MAEDRLQPNHPQATSYPTFQDALCKLIASPKEQADRDLARAKRPWIENANKATSNGSEH